MQSNNGFAELQTELQDIAKGVSDTSRKEALEEGAEIITARARTLAPVRTGLIKREGITKGNNNGESIEVGWTKDGFYGRFLEYGTRKMAPRSHIRPAYEQTQSQVMNVMLKKMKLN